MVNYKIDVGGGGVFSKYMIAIESLSHVNSNIENVYINVIDERTNNDIFDEIFNQTFDENYLNLNMVYPNNINNTENHHNLDKYKKIITKFSFKKELIEEIEGYQKSLCIDENTVGVHVRLTDMNIYHLSDYGYSDFNSYLNRLNKTDNYFVASDNEESLNKLIEIFGDKIKYVPNLIRTKNEKEDSLNLQLTNFKNKNFWKESFIEMMLLSKCGSLICRTSCLASASIIHSNTIKNIIRIK